MELEKIKQLLAKDLEIDDSIALSGRISDVEKAESHVINSFRSRVKALEIALVALTKLTHIQAHFGFEYGLVIGPKETSIQWEVDIEKAIKEIAAILGLED